jgi:hypothetical protein
MKGASASGQAARDLGLADAGGADHQDVLGRDLGAQLASTCWRRQRLRSAMATALGGVLADDVAVQLGDDFLRRHRAHSRTSKVWFWLV